MQREILFRGKSIHYHQWIEGYFVGDNTIVKTEDMMYDLGYIDTSRCYECYPESIGQFTGLTDINGKKIFEGDIILSKEVGGYGQVTTSFVKYDNDRCAFMLHNDKAFIDKEVRFQKGKCDFNDGYCTVSYSMEYEIIGKVYDNKDLLK